MQKTLSQKTSSGQEGNEERREQQAIDVAACCSQFKLHDGVRRQRCEATGRCLSGDRCGHLRLSAAPDEDEAALRAEGSRNAHGASASVGQSRRDTRHDVSGAAARPEADAPAQRSGMTPFPAYTGRRAGSLAHLAYSTVTSTTARQFALACGTKCPRRRGSRRARFQA